jgi:hypothetical protein
MRSQPREKGKVVAEGDEERRRVRVSAEKRGARWLSHGREGKGKGERRRK